MCRDTKCHGLFETILRTGSMSYLSDDTGILFCTRFQRWCKEQEICLRSFIQNRGKSKTQPLHSSCGPSKYSCSIAEQETSNLSITAHDWAFRECPLGPYADTESVLKPGQSGEGGESMPCFLHPLFLVYSPSFRQTCKCAFTVGHTYPRTHHWDPKRCQ